MTNTEKLKQYLLEKENAFLLNSNNNGKTIMLSGTWGAGKTHFWQNEIEPILSGKLKKENKACVYVSLYGKESISEVKFEIFKEAYNAIVDEDIISKGASLLSSIAPSFGEKSLVDGFDKLNQQSKDNKSKEILKEGSVVCLDDFERKSKNIDLNDLFGLISHLALSLNCKVIIILNSDVFEAEEAEVFKRVKEKTVNKFFNFNPSTDELFKSISKDIKYNNLENYKSKIRKVIKETEELNARLYIQVLDNCLEWIDSSRELNDNIIRVLVLTTINFVLNHIVLDYQEVKISQTNSVDFSTNEPIVNGTLKYDNIAYYDIIPVCRYTLRAHNYDEYIEEIKSYSEIDFIKNIKSGISKEISTPKEEEVLSRIKENEQELKALWKYGYRLYYVGDVDKETYKKIAEFIETGILLSRLTHEL